MSRYRRGSATKTWHQQFVNFDIYVLVQTGNLLTDPSQVPSTPRLTVVKQQIKLTLGIVPSVMEGILNISTAFWLNSIFLYTLLSQQQQKKCYIWKFLLWGSVFYWMRISLIQHTYNRESWYYQYLAAGEKKREKKKGHTMTRVKMYVNIGV